jgi:hypothetical protein
MATAKRKQEEAADKVSASEASDQECDLDDVEVTKRMKMGNEHHHHHHLMQHSADVMAPMTTLGPAGSPL